MQVFISYARDDVALVRRVASFLETSGFNVVWDQTSELLPGENWAESIARGLKE